MSGINRALIKDKIIVESFSIKKPCIFLSHRSLDKEMVEEIAKFIMSLNIDVYFDKYDEVLQWASESKNDELTTLCIHDGLNESTHVMCILSKDTVTSWWVPYEIGFAESIEKKIFSAKLKVLDNSYIPSYLKVRDLLNGPTEIKNYLFDIAEEYNLLNESTIIDKKYFSSNSNDPFIKYF